MFIMTEQNLNLAQDCFVYPMNQKKRSGSCACVVVVGSQSSGSTHAQDYTGFLFTNIFFLGIEVECGMGDVGELWRECQLAPYTCSM